MALFPYVLLLLLGYVNSENATLVEEDACYPRDGGPWSALLERWAAATPSPLSGRHGRILALPGGTGYYVTERIDGPFAPPPPPPHHPPGPPSHGGHVPQNYNEWEAGPPSPGGKIVNRPPSPYKDKFKPSYPAPPGPAPPAGPPPARPPRPGAADRVDEPPRKHVSETDLYLLSAIEKLVYRVDLMEKRLRKMEENVHYLVAGADTKPEPCPGNFTRAGGGCYRWSSEAADWQTASAACRRQRAALLELRDRAQRRVVLAALLADRSLRGVDFWTGGLNPGLLWIWSHSARPVATNDTDDAGAAVAGEGRCLALVHDPAVNAYAYRGRDCALRHRYVCQKDEDETKLSNEIEKAARSLKLEKARKARVLWDDIV